MSSRPVESSLPQPLSIILPKVYPLILDGTSSVRLQCFKLLRVLPHDEMPDHVSEVLPYVRAGMTHLAADIRTFSIEVLAWLIEIAPNEVVSCAGGWVKTLHSFLALLGWHTQDTTKWSSNRVNFGQAGSDGKAQARNLQVLAELLKAGFNQPFQTDERGHSESSFPIWQMEHHELPKRSNPYGYLNLFGARKDDEVDMLEDPEDRIRAFNEKFAHAIEIELPLAKKDGGEVGRAAGLVAKAWKGT